METESRFDLTQGTLDLLIQRVVALGPSHAQKIPQMSGEVLQIQQGTLYPALRRFEYKRLLAAKWQPSETGREAKFYELSIAGRAQLKPESAHWERFTDVVARVLKGPLEGVS
jgi:PadR family transcriptional regulator PadR